MANLMHLTISPKLENIVKNKKQKKTEAKLITQMSNHSTLMVTKGGHQILSPRIELSP